MQSLEASTTASHTPIKCSLLSPLHSKSQTRLPISSMNSTIHFPWFSLRSLTRMSALFHMNTQLIPSENSHGQYWCCSLATSLVRRCCAFSSKRPPLHKTWKLPPGIPVTKDVAPAVIYALLLLVRVRRNVPWGLVSSFPEALLKSDEQCADATQNRHEGNRRFEGRLSWNEHEEEASQKKLTSRKNHQWQIYPFSEDALVLQWHKINIVGFS